MRIALYAPVFVRPTETFIYDAARELAASGIEVHVVAGARALAEERPFAGVRLAPAPGRRDAARLLRRLLRPLTGAKGDDEALAVQSVRIRRHLGAIRPEVVLANYGHGGVLCEPACRALALPLVVSFHGADATRAPRSLVWMARYRRLFATAALVTAPSEYIRERLEAMGCPAGKLRVQRYGIRVDTDWTERPSQRFDGRTVRFLFVGRLTAKKAPVTLLEAFARARSALAPALDAQLAMIGDGPLRKDVETAIARLGLDGGVALLGRQPHEAVLAHYRSAQVYVQHSVTTARGDQEGLPVSITEAMAAGLPVVSTRHSGIPEAVVHGRTGFLVAEHDVEGMAARMTELARDPAARDAMGAAGRERLEAEFAMPVVQARLRALLAEAAGPTAGGFHATGAGSPAGG